MVVGKTKNICSVFSNCKITKIIMYACMKSLIFTNY